ncbi:MAG: sodium-dependent transporter, partial [Fusobacteriaceae bacterium]
GILTCFIILSYYSVIGGWVIKYILDFLLGGVNGDAGVHFGGFISGISSPIIYAGIFLILTALIVVKGISGGIEKASKFMMPALFLFLIIIVVRAITLPGAMAGIEFLLKPDFSKITGGVILAALGQVFFSLSLGMGAMVTYGSYLPSDSKLVRSALIVPGLDTLVALLAGLAVMPAVFSFGLEPSAGPGLLFVTLPKIFESMAFGAFFGVIFFILVFFAAITSSISMLEVVVAFVVDQMKLDRKITTWVLTLLLFLVAIPNSLSFGILEKSKMFFGMNFFDFLCYLSDNLFLPIGGLLLCIFIGYIWGEKGVLYEITNEGKLDFFLGKLWIFVIKYVGPVVIGIILLQALGILKF